MKRPTALLCLAMICGGGGCADGAAKPERPSADATAAAAPGKGKGHKAPIGAAFFPTQPGADHQRPHDAREDPRLLVQLSVYKLTVPARAVSRNEEFWKHVDETSIDVGQHDLLFTNGFRVGVAPRSDWDYFKKILERDTIISQLTGAGGVGGSSLEMPFKQAVPEQAIFYLHPTKGLVGQVYDKHDESMAIHFEPVARQVGDVRITVVPVISYQRTEILYTARNEAQPYTFGHKRFEFDLKLQVDVPLDHFLILAPSSEAEDHTASLGNKMLCFDQNGQQYETVLVLAPQPFVFDSPTTPATQPTTQPSIAEK